jgi:preprotein translocase subunit SecA
MKKLISEIKIESNNLIKKTEEELIIQIEKIKKRAKTEPLEALMIPWFALVQEVSSRTIGLKHFDTQLLAGFYLHQGKIVEMKTGEGKTLASTLPIALNALNKKGVHVVTVNEYLAERDQKWMGKVYNSLGLSTGLVKNDNNLTIKRKNYSCDITYLTNSEVVFDFLRDSSASHLNELVQRPFSYCLIDEIDSILIDEARTPLILSTSKGVNNINKLHLAKAIANSLEKEIDFELDEKRKDINLTEKGYKKTKEKLAKKSLYDSKDPWILELLNALKAKYLFKRDKDYIVLNNKILIVDEFTGRIMEDRRWSLGIHEAVEVKENVELGGSKKTKSSITYQNFFTLYPKLAGMTGTAKTADKEFKDIYQLDVVVLPTAKPMVRKDLSDLVYQTELAKWKAVLIKSRECFEKGQPILIGTASVEKSEFLSELFKVSNLPHQILNAKPENVTRESEVIAQAGKRYAITIATNMAGRGTDIILGGNPIFTLKQKIADFLLFKHEEKEKEKENLPLSNISFQEKESFMKERIEILAEYLKKSDLNTLEKDIKNLPYSLDNSLPSFRNFYQSFYQEIHSFWEKENQKVKDLGGLFVLGTERHETRRIDNQLRGRAGRQGDPGTSQFFVSLEDDLIKIFGGESIKQWIEYLIQEEDTPLESDLLTTSLENAQKKVEVYNYELRKNVYQYDDILNNQRKQLFQARNQILVDNILNELFLRSSESFLDIEFTKRQKEENIPNFEFSSIFEKWFDSYSAFLLEREKNERKSTKKKEIYRQIWITHDLRFAQSNFYQAGFLKVTRFTTLLSIVDQNWTEHIERMNYIRETINWRSYGQENPLVEYNLEGFKSFYFMFDQIRSSMLYYSLNNPIN